MLVLLIIGTGACQTPKEKTAEKPITVSILPQKYFVQALLGPEYPVNVMVAPGASPASYEPTPRQIAELSNSDLYLKIGHLGFEEAWMERIQRAHPDLQLVDLSNGIQLLGAEEEHSGHEEEAEKAEEETEGEHHHHGGIDPHIWMSPKQVMRMLNTLSHALVDYDEDRRDLIVQRTDSIQNLLNILDQEFHAILDPLKNKKFIIFHPALTYLANDYGLEQIAMEFEGKEPSPAYFKSIVDRAKKEGIRILFIQKEFDVENAKQMAREIDANLIQIDPLAENWLAQMRDILKKLQKLDSSAG